MARASWSKRISHTYGWRMKGLLDLCNLKSSTCSCNSSQGNTSRWCSYHLRFCAACSSKMLPGPCCLTKEANVSGSPIKHLLPTHQELRGLSKAGQYLKVQGSKQTLHGREGFDILTGSWANISVVQRTIGSRLYRLGFAVWNQDSSYMGWQLCAWSGPVYAATIVTPGIYTLLVTL